MLVRCPHCRERVDVIEDSDLSAIDCPSCESCFSLLGEMTATYEASKPAQRTLGHFELTERLGVGSFGAVWMARDTELDRTVAIKVPRKGQLDASDAELFLREARAAAQLRHPNIVPVHEVGREDGDVYIVCDYIEGLTLSDYLLHHPPSVGEAAELTVKLARALEHAHAAGIVHRDFKSTNVMIDRDGEPHVMDFGLAKRETNELTMTMDGQVLGTPAYMSPEQAKGEARTADRRSDIYSLGVVLFELLTGHRPFRGNSSMLLAQVINDDPPNPRKLNGNVPRDLETICLRCLQKDPGKRYQSAGELADDIERWGRKEPIHARPIGALERGVRWCQRRPAVASLLALTVVITIAGFSGVTWQLRRTQIARQDADENSQEAQRQQKAAEASFQQAMRAVEQMLTRVGNEKLSNVPLMEDVRRELLEDALAFYLEFLDERATDPQLRAETAKAYLRVGEINRLLARNAKAEQSFAQASDLFKRLINDFPNEPSHREDLGTCAFERGVLLANLGRSPEAEQSFITARDLFERLHQDYPEAASYQAKLSRSCNAVGIMLKSKRPEDAELLVRRAIKLRLALQERDGVTPTGTHRLAQMHLSLGSLLVPLKGSTAAERDYLEAERLMKSLMETQPKLPAYRKTLINAYTGLGRTNRIANPGKAEGFYRLALQQQTELSEAFPQVVQHRADLASNHYNLALVLKTLKDYDGAAEAYRRSAGIRSQLAEEFPEAPQYARLLSKAYGSFALLPSLKQSEAEEIAQKAVDAAAALVKQFPAIENQQQLATAHTRFGSVIAKVDAERAEEQYQQAIDIHKQIIAEAPDAPEFQFDLIRTRHSIAFGLSKSPEPKRSVIVFKQAIEELELLVRAHRNRPSFERELADIYDNYAWLRGTKTDESIRDSAIAERMSRKAIAIKPNVGAFYLTLGAALYYSDQWQDAIEALEKSIEMKSTSAAGPFLLAMAHWQNGDKEQAAEWLERGLAVEKPDETGLFYRDQAKAMISPTN